MRYAILALALLAVPGCVASGARPLDDDSKAPTSSQKLRASEEWVEQLTMEGVNPENRAGRTMFLMRRLIEYRPQSTTVVLQRGVRHPNDKVRENCAFFLAYAGEAAAEEALMQMLDDAVVAVRYSAAASLLQGYQEEAGIPHLLQALRSDTVGHRREAVKVLREYSRQYFAFDPEGPPAERNFTATKWDEWWKQR